MLIIGVTGQSGAGKDTIGRHFISKHRFVKVALADHMKRYLREVYEFSNDQLWGSQEARNAPDMRYPDGKGGFLSARKALQTLGTEWGRACWENTWVRLCLRAADKIEKGYEYSCKNGLSLVPLRIRRAGGVVITDVRFKNEMEAIKAHGGVVVRVTRPGTDGNIAGGVKNHASETEQKDVPDSEMDYVFSNSGTEAELLLEADKVYARLGAIALTRRPG